MPDKEIFVLKIVWKKSIASLHRLTQAVQCANLRRTAGDPTWVLNLYSSQNVFIILLSKMRNKNILVLKIVWRKSIASLHRLTQAVQRANLRRTVGDLTWVYQISTTNPESASPDFYFTQMFLWSKFRIRRFRIGCWNVIDKIQNHGSIFCAYK